jgi:Ca2+-binding RTX toxin-like protein
MYMALRYPELIGTSGSNIVYSTSYAVAMGLAGDDDMGGGSAIWIGGSGNDYYYIDQTSLVTIAERSGTGDVLVATGIGLGRATTKAMTLDERHLFVFDSASGQGVVLLDWLVPAMRIETVQLAGVTYSHASFAAAVQGFAGYLGNRTWEQASAEGYYALLPDETTAVIDEAIEYYRARSIQLEEPRFAVTDTASGTAGEVVAVTYAGPVARLDLQFLGTDSGEAIGGTAFSDFINGMGGDDAIAAGLGDDVLDGGTGSNFLTGGHGVDTFFLDGRGGMPTWSTITDWEPGEQLSLWGWLPGVSAAHWVDEDGVAGFRGVTLHADLNGDGTVETSVTWSGRSQADLPAPNAFDGLLWFV